MTTRVMLPAEDTFLQRDVVKVKQFLTLYSGGQTDDDWVWPSPASCHVPRMQVPALRRVAGACAGSWRAGTRRVDQ